MRNRAKCRKCGDIIESKSTSDFVSCKCGEISIDGGQSELHIRRLAKSWSNFLAVDDEGNEICYDPTSDMEPPKLKRSDLLHMLDTMASDIQRLPTGAAMAPINHFDHYNLLILLAAIFRSEHE